MLEFQSGQAYLVTYETRDIGYGVEDDFERYMVFGARENGAGKLGFTLEDGTAIYLFEDEILAASPSEVGNTQTFKLDRHAHTNIVAALIHYAMHVAEPSECINNLEKLVPEPTRPWGDVIFDGRAAWRKLANVADKEVAAMREP